VKRMSSKPDRSSCRWPISRAAKTRRSPISRPAIVQSCISFYRWGWSRTSLHVDQTFPAWVISVSGTILALDAELAQHIFVRKKR